MIMNKPQRCTFDSLAFVFSKLNTHTARSYKIDLEPTTQAFINRCVFAYVNIGRSRWCKHGRTQERVCPICGNDVHVSFYSLYYVSILSSPWINPPSFFSVSQVLVSTTHANLGYHDPIAELLSTTVFTVPRLPFVPSHSYHFYAQLSAGSSTPTKRLWVQRSFVVWVVSHLKQLAGLCFGCCSSLVFSLYSEYQCNILFLVSKHSWWLFASLPEQMVIQVNI